MNIDIDQKMVHCGNAPTLTKVGANSEVYAVLMDGTNMKEGSNSNLRFFGNEGRPCHRSCSRMSTCFVWLLLLAVPITCLTVLGFHMRATWYLQEKLDALQAQVDSISALDLEDLRSQLRDLYDMSTERDTTGFRGHPTSADEDQVNVINLFL